MYNIELLVEHLESMADEKYRRFNESLIPGAKNTSLGVRLPTLRKIAKEILKTDFQAFLKDSLGHSLYEIRILHAIVLGNAKIDIHDKINLTEKFLPFIDNWAVCDTFCSSFKPRSDEKESLFAFVQQCAESDMEFRKRFGLIMMMNYYREAPWIETVLNVYRGFQHEGYYARMAAAWGLATLFLFDRAGVLEILKSNTLDKFTHNKSIQKMIESYRVSDEDKQLLRALRRK